jgi:hypothetical protein
VALDCIITGREAARTALSAYNCTLYSNKRDPNAALPHAWMYSGSEARAQFRGWSEDIVYLHIWTTSQASAQELENAVIFLDDYSAANSSNAIGIRWTMQSKTRLVEDDLSTWHTAILYAVRYGDKRKLLVS